MLNYTKNSLFLQKKAPGRVTNKNVFRKKALGRVTNRKQKRQTTFLSKFCGSGGSCQDIWRFRRFRSNIFDHPIRVVSVQYIPPATGQYRVVSQYGHPEVWADLDYTNRSWLQFIAWSRFSCPVRLGFRAQFFDLIFDQFHQMLEIA